MQEAVSLLKTSKTKHRKGKNETNTKQAEWSDSENDNFLLNFTQHIHKWLLWRGRDV